MNPIRISASDLYNIHSDMMASAYSVCCPPCYTHVSSFRPTFRLYRARPAYRLLYRARPAYRLLYRARPAYRLQLATYLSLLVSIRRPVDL
jgi:hypothetical protein